VGCARTCTGGCTDARGVGLGEILGEMVFSALSCDRGGGGGSARWEVPVAILGCGLLVGWGVGARVLPGLAELGVGGRVLLGLVGRGGIGARVLTGLSWMGVGEGVLLDLSEMGGVVAERAEL
jgi:hypothetical protein